MQQIGSVHSSQFPVLVHLAPSSNVRISRYGYTSETGTTVAPWDAVQAAALPAQVSDNRLLPMLQWTSMATASGIGGNWLVSGHFKMHHLWSLQSAPPGGC
jgi:hypothetical protein